MTGTATAERHDGETIEGLFQPDILAPAQYFEGFKKEQARAPERDLVLAILEDAVLSFQRYLKSSREKERHIFTDAEEWFLSDDRDWVFSFLNVCDFLGLDAEFLRKGLFRWKEAALSGAGGEIPESTGAGEDASGTMRARHADEPDRRRRHCGGWRPESPQRRRARQARGRSLGLVRKKMRGL